MRVWPDNPLCTFILDERITIEKERMEMARKIGRQERFDIPGSEIPSWQRGSYSNQAYS